MGSSQKVRDPTAAATPRPPSTTTISGAGRRSSSAVQAGLDSRSHHCQPSTCWPENAISKHQPCR